MCTIVVHSMQPQYQLGDLVKVKNDTSEQERSVLGYSVTASGIRYIVSSVEVDPIKKQLIDGVLHCEEQELERISHEE